MTRDVTMRETATHKESSMRLSAFSKLPQGAPHTLTHVHSLTLILTHTHILICISLLYLPLLAVILSATFIFSIGAAAAVEGVVTGEPCAGDAEFDAAADDGASAAVPPPPPTPPPAAFSAFVEPALPVESGVVAGVALPDTGTDPEPDPVAGATVLSTGVACCVCCCCDDGGALTTACAAAAATAAALAALL